MNPTISKRISICNVLGAVLIVLLHSSVASNLTENGNNYLFAYSWFKCVNIISDVAVPTFFAISGLLLFKDYSYDKYIGKVKQRSRTLMVPYFCYSLLMFLYYCILSLVPALHESAMELLGNFTIGSIIKTILLASCDPPIWYLRVLFALVVISPILNMIISKLKENTIIFVVFLSIFNIFANTPYSSAIYWCPVFLLGAICSTQSKIKEVVSKEYSNICIAITLVIYMLLVAIVYHNTIPELYYVYRMLSPVIVWILASIIPCPKKIPFWFKTTFFVFCLHYPVSQIVRVLLTKLIGNNNIWLVLVNVITSVAVIAIINIIAYLMQKKCQILWRVLNGGR